MTAARQPKSKPARCGKSRRPRRRMVRPNYGLFSARKQQWVAANPAATCAEYDLAVQRIAKECGV